MSDNEREHIGGVHVDDLQAGDTITFRSGNYCTVEREIVPKPDPVSALYDYLEQRGDAALLDGLFIIAADDFQESLTDALAGTQEEREDNDEYSDDADLLLGALGVEGY